jgi:hypothetical protein
VTTRCRWGSSPSEWVSTPPRSRRNSCTWRRSLAVIASRATGRPASSASSAASAAWRSSASLAGRGSPPRRDDARRCSRPAWRPPAARGAARRRSSARGAR